jgi:hypothetical protein
MAENEKWLIEDEKWIVEQSLADSDNWVIQTANTQRYIGSSNDLDYVYLFAASPLMLEALETLTAVIGLTPIAGNKAAVQEAFNQARAAIAAAKGE